MSADNNLKRKPSTLGRVIATTAGVTVAYLMSVGLEARADVIFGLLGLTFAATVWMVVRILKDPYSTGKTFGEQFYQDRDDIRRNKVE